MSRNAPDLTHYVTRQGGHVTREQLYACGVARRTVDRWIAGGRLIRVHRGVYAVGHIPVRPADRAHAALLAGGPRSALAGASALVVWGIWRRWPDPLEIVVAGNRRAHGLRLHRSGTLLARDVTVQDGLRVTSPARTLLDTATRLSGKQLKRAVADLRLRDLLTVAQLADVVDRNRTHAGAPQLRPLIETAQQEPTRSDLEDAFMDLVRKHGLPVPLINVHVGGHRVDAFFPDHRLVVELDGWASHKTREAFVNDRRQDSEVLWRTGIPTVRIPYDDTVRGEGVERLRGLLAVRA